ncbi:MAG: hypothetical protein AB7S38_23785 [Vulcanimicrobiota bacterium]
MKRFASLLLVLLVLGAASAKEKLTEAACDALRQNGLPLKEMTRRYGAASFTDKDVTDATCAKFRVAGLPRGPEQGTNYYYVTPHRIYQFVGLPNGQLVYRGAAFRLSEEAYLKVMKARK